MRRRSLIALVAVSTLGLGCEASTDTDTDSDPDPVDEVTYYGDVATILNDNCVSCHVAGGIGPFALDDYTSAKTSSAAIKAATESGRMPPFHVDASGDCNEYKDARILSDEQISTLAAWSKAGAPEGDPADAPPPPAELPTLEAVSLTLDPAVEYTPNPNVDDDYRCFIIDPGLESDAFLTAYQVKPGVLSEVHHVVVFSIDSDEQELAAAELDAGEEGPGYTCYGGPGTGGAPRTLVVWAPGTGATKYPEDTGLRVAAGRPVVMQVHYNQGTLPDRTTIDLTLEESVPYEAFISAAINLNLSLTPGMADVGSEVTAPFDATGVSYRVHGVYPHMHTYGRSMRATMLQDGEETCLVNVPDYAFGWQQFFFYEDPVVVDGNIGGSYSIECSYDTRGATGPIGWGEGTGDEMCIAGLYITL